MSYYKNNRERSLEYGHNYDINHRLKFKKYNHDYYMQYIKPKKVDITKKKKLSETKIIKEKKESVKEKKIKELSLILTFD